MTSEMRSVSTLPRTQTDAGIEVLRKPGTLYENVSSWVRELVNMVFCEDAC